ncbi:Zn-dependent alcohol dehydrogenase [Kineococcus rhizosphaerae]|uniref:S-(Hydroxymethyl)glutathione dehydrogenase/alcohol dehydrogenase n=1 Tax=Kineococcus rhizosphaerae TaxID=559628 RepID=A0A2T0QUT4_9ACTN|nr:Zn-dependent alcohol dehydrogenase [Kineococcus rhizosphaerae]PRY08826.1 S-(hydroxymethyl)glutathione dehydrogenase/alcohol dehydrogenase [Kineococcus rhizosphaerae]
MRAAVLVEPGRLDLQDVVLDEPGPREVEIRTAAVGLCHSDLHYIDGTFSTSLPEILGHEAAGVVTRVGSEVESVRIGDHVVTCLTIFCGHCRYCTDGHLSICANRSALRKRPRPVATTPDGTAIGTMSGIGGFAERMVVHENGVVAVPAGVPLDRACLVGCSVLTGVGATTRSVRIPLGADVLVVGCGGVGMAAVQGARLGGAGRVIAVDISPAKLDAAKEFGATHVINAAHQDVLQAVRELTGAGVDFAFEAIGRRETVEQAVACLGPGGTATVLGMIPDDQPVRIPATDLLFNEKKLQGSFIGSNQFRTDVPRLLELYAQGRLKLDEMISMRLPMDHINEGFDALRRGEVTRAVVEVSQA